MLWKEENRIYTTHTNIDTDTLLDYGSHIHVTVFHHFQKQMQSASTQKLMLQPDKLSEYLDIYYSDKQDSQYTEAVRCENKHFQHDAEFQKQFKLWTGQMIICP